MEQGIISQISGKLDEPVVLFVLVLIGAAALATMINAIWKLVDRFTGKKLSQPLEVKASTVFVKQEECVARNLQTKAELDRIERDLKTLREERAADVKSAAVSRHGIYDKIEEVRSEMNVGFKEMERAIGRIEGKLERNDTT